MTTASFLDFYLANISISCLILLHQVFVYRIHVLPNCINFKTNFKKSVLKKVPIELALMG